MKEKIQRVQQVQLSDIVITITHKKIKNLHLKILPPEGAVQVSAPLWMSIQAIRSFVMSKLDWIKKQQKKLHNQHREPPREYLSYESHYIWGKRYLLKIIDSEQSPKIALEHSEIYLHIQPDASKEKKQAVLESWYRMELKRVLPSLIAKWEQVIGVKVKQFFIQKMKTRWGSCNYRVGNIRFNLELAKRSIECLEYIVVHEMVHLLEPSHNQRFVAFMDQFMPKWRFYKDELNHFN